jgi:hypothetical protein
MLKRSVIAAALVAAVVTMAACGSPAHPQPSSISSTSAKPSGVYGIVVVQYPPSVSVNFTLSPPRLPGGFGLADWRIPITDANLIVRATGSHGPARKVLTGDDGIFEVELSPGRYVISLGDPPFGGSLARAGTQWRVEVRKDRSSYRAEVTVRSGEYTRVVIGPSPSPDQVVGAQ